MTTLIVIAAHLLHILLSGHYLFPPACNTGEAWTYIPEHQLYACHAPYPAKVQTP